MNGEWLHWYYLIYLLPAAAAILVLLLSGIGGHHGAHSHGAHAHLHLHTHHGAGLHSHAQHGGHSATASHSHPAHGAPGAHHGHGAHGPGDSRPASLGQQMLAFFGFGRAPLTIVVGSLMIGWGFFGWLALEILRPILHYPALFFPASLPCAVAGGLLFGKLFGELAARL